MNNNYQDNTDFSNNKTDIKPIAFYLPQYHQIPENDKYWGEGFTEWCNVKKAKSRFENHYMPRIPHQDIGYYDLSDYHVIEQQAKLAKQHGIYGFCFYAYWFSGKRLLEKPLDLLIAHPKININFCICWANENWTRTWDGQEKNILIEQKYQNEDPINFINDMSVYLRDPRYIKIDNKPLIIVYAPQSIPNCKEVFTKWRQTALEIGIGEITIYICRTFQNTAKTLGLSFDVDAEIEFPPHNIAPEAYDKQENNYFKMKYNEMVNLWNYNIDFLPVYRSVCLGWDNSARKEKDWLSFNDFTIQKYREWLHKAISQTRLAQPIDKRFIFINAWNEWGEGTYLEPDEAFGYAYLNETSKEIFNLK